MLDSSDCNFRVPGDCVSVVRVRTDLCHHYECYCPGAGSSRSYHGIYDGGISNNDLKTPISSEIKDGQWLGVAVSSQGEKCNPPTKICFLLD